MNTKQNQAIITWVFDSQENYEKAISNLDTTKAESFLNTDSPYEATGWSIFNNNSIKTDGYERLIICNVKEGDLDNFMSQYNNVHIPHISSQSGYIRYNLGTDSEQVSLFFLKNMFICSIF